MDIVGQCFCHRVEVFFNPGGAGAGLPGRIYSQAGLDEFRISGMCETGFDAMFPDDDDDDELGF
mgnify:FL=1